MVKAKRRSEPDTRSDITAMFSSNFARIELKNGFDVFEDGMRGVGRVSANVWWVLSLAVSLVKQTSVKSGYLV